MMFKTENCHKHYYGSSLNIKQNQLNFLKTVTIQQSMIPL